jgi:hypothetical protein
MSAMESGPAPQTVGALARSVLAAVEPQQLEAYDEVAAAWWSGELHDDGSGDHLAGTRPSGLTAGALVYLILPIVSGAVAQVLGAPADRALRRWRLRRRRRTDLALTAALLEQAPAVRQAIHVAALKARVAPAKADLIADAGEAALARAAAARLAPRD